MPTLCATLNASNVYDCDNPLVGGLEKTIYVFNADDWKGATLTKNAAGIVTGIALPSGAKAYKITVFKRGILSGKFEESKTNSGPRFKHSVGFTLANNTAAAKSFWKALAYGTFVIVGENIQRTGDLQFEIYGAGSGLEVNDLNRDTAADDGAVKGTFVNDDAMLEGDLPLTLQYPGTTGGTDYSYAATKAALEAFTATS
jgi:hypothetical protein